jgi:hypothetical protein
MGEPTSSRLITAARCCWTKAIQVQGPHNVVVVYRGVERESYSCAPKCERRITLGDTKDYFDSTLNQTGSRNGQATGTGAAAGQK